MSEEIEETIIVTGRRLSDGGSTSIASGGSGVPLAATILSFSQQPKPDAFQQEGGEENIITTSFAMIDGNVVVRLPGYDFPIKIPAATWDRMSSTQKGALIKLFTEFSQSPHLVQFQPPSKSGSVGG